jgi:AcrR family transcriptional regulator
VIAPVPVPARPDPDPHRDPVAIAMVDLAVELGYEGVGVEALIERAGVPREEFERRFAGKEDCAMKVFDAYSTDFEWRVGTAYNRHSEWRDALRAAAQETASWMMKNPNLVRFGTVEVLAMASEMARVRREEVFVYCATLIDGGRAEAADPNSIPEGASVVAVGSIMHLLTHRLQRGDAVDPQEIIPEMMYGVVRPFLGEEVARLELAPPPPEPS